MLIIPFQVHAGLVSFVSNLFNNPTAEAETTPVDNSQNMSLLHAAVNSDPNPAKGPSDITIVADSALLPESGPSGTMADVQDEPVNTQISVYVVRDGDSLGKIAKLFGVTTNTILWANDLPAGSSIKPGQTLVILPVSGIKYTVKKGDTAQSLAKKYKADATEIIDYNGLAADGTLVSGDEIIIPDGEPTPPAQSYDQSPSSPSGQNSNYPERSMIANRRINPRLHGADGPSYPGYYMRPIVGGRKTQGLHGYNGVDLADPIGTPIHAAAAGVVIVSKTGGWNSGYGNYVVISHPNGTQTLYGHTMENLVSVGDVVTQGQEIARIGLTGNTTGPHVHFEVRGAQNPF